MIIFLTKGKLIMAVTGTTHRYSAFQVNKYLNLLFSCSILLLSFYLHGQQVATCTQSRKEQWIPLVLTAIVHNVSYLVSTTLLYKSTWILHFTDTTFLNKSSCFFWPIPTNSYFYREKRLNLFLTQQNKWSSKQILHFNQGWD